MKLITYFSESETLCFDGPQWKVSLTQNLPLRNISIVIYNEKMHSKKYCKATVP